MLEKLRQLVRKEEDEEVDQEETTLEDFDSRQEKLDARIAALKVIADTVSRNE